eukprot:gene4539-5804_t
MQAYQKPAIIRWADLDPNFHLRHSAYYDIAAQVRNEYLEDNGVTLPIMKQLHFGPVIFREECLFRREVLYGEKISVKVELTKLRRDFSRWAVRNTFLKEDGTVAALLTVEGAWMDTKARKLTAPPSIGAEVMDSLPK